jgi:hypothetical protein
MDDSDRRVRAHAVRALDQLRRGDRSDGTRVPRSADEESFVDP